ncbi:MAG: hypothetical protein QXI12_11290 [Candidatus Methanomethyliaceae archaeon]
MFEERPGFCGAASAQGLRPMGFKQAVDGGCTQTEEDLFCLGANLEMSMVLEDHDDSGKKGS